MVLRCRLQGHTLYALGLLFYMAAALVVFAGMTADSQWRCHHSWPNICDEQMVADDRGAASFIAAFPPCWVIAFFATDGFYRGFSLTATPHIRREIRSSEQP